MNLFSRFSDYFKILFFFLFSIGGVYFVLKLVSHMNISFLKSLQSTGHIRHQFLPRTYEINLQQTPDSYRFGIEEAGITIFVLLLCWIAVAILCYFNFKREKDDKTSNRIVDALLIILLLAFPIGFVEKLANQNITITRSKMVRVEKKSLFHHHKYKSKLLDFAYNPGSADGIPASLFLHNKRGYEEIIAGNSKDIAGVCEYLAKRVRSKYYFL